MTTMRTISDDLERYTGTLILDNIISRKNRRYLRLGLLITALGSGLGGVVLPWYFADAPAHLLIGISFLASAFWLEQMLLHSYHNSFYFHGLNSILGLDLKKTSGITYEVATTVAKSKEDVTAAFCLSPIGRVVLARLAISEESLQTFLASSRTKISIQMIPLLPDTIFSLISLGNYLIQQDSAFKKLIRDNGASEEAFYGALTWIVQAHHTIKKRDRWWGKDNLSKTKGIGREWSYGTPFLLEKFSRNINTSAVFSTLTASNSAFSAEKISEVEVALARAKAANVLLIGEAGVGAIDLLMEVNRRLQSGTSLGSVENQKMVVLDTNRLFATHKDKQELELTILSLFTEAYNAGNIIIVIENISSVIREAEAMGVFLPEILDQFLASPQLHVVATDTPGAYHTYLETLGGFSRRFAEVLIDTPSLASSVKVLQDIALANESRYNVLFTYTGITTIASAADRYIVEGAMPDKAIELMLDIATRAAQSGKRVIDTDFVYAVVSEKTGIPAGPITDSERDLLLHIEDKLHERVIGQERAIDAIARTMRRARAGIQSTEKPIGSFLFLGPTGVGKTETAKALAHVFFGDEKKMHRIDMSEFSGPDGLSRLIGDGTNSGILPDMLREHPYAVLLLDEFEKGARAVHDIFLQVLDEGVFTDARGERVNARNTIVIATSNAGSQLILQTIAQRKELATLTQEIINHIVKEGTYRPELLNRFDSTIIFEPLQLEEQGQIAGLMLGGLYERVKERGYELIISRDLMDLLVTKGYSQEFGARPMQRVLQDVVEEKIAQLIISGAVAPGGTIALAASDFSELELSV